MSDAGEGSISDHMKKGQGIIKGFQTVGMGLEGEAAHPEITGDDPMRRGPGRPPKNESSFRTVGRTAEEENGSKPD